MRPQTLRVFGLVFLAALSLIAFATLFGNHEQPFTKTPSQLSAIQTKSFGNKLISNQASLSKLMNGFMPEPEYDPEVALIASQGRGHLEIPGPGLRDDYDLSGFNCGQGNRCL